MVAGSYEQVGEVLKHRMTDNTRFKCFTEKKFQIGKNEERLQLGIRVKNKSLLGVQTKRREATFEYQLACDGSSIDFGTKVHIIIGTK